MTTIDKIGKKINFSFFIFHFSLLLMFTSVASADFSRNNDTKIVTDNETGLQWQDNETITKVWQDAIDYCENLTLGDYGDWRLPNIRELTSLVDDTKNNPSIDSTFQNVVSNNYWSSTTNANPSSLAWVVNFYYGGQSYNGKDANHSVRCVRAGQ